MEKQNGEGVNFNYMPGSHLLEKITDDNGRSIWLTRKDNYLIVTSYSVQGNLVIVRSLTGMKVIIKAMSLAY